MVKATKSDRYGKLQRLLKPERFLFTVLYGRQGLNAGEKLYYFLMPDGVTVFIQAYSFVEADKLRTQLINSIHQTSDIMEKERIYMVNGHRFKSAWQVKSYLDQHNYIETDRETLIYKDCEVILINVASK